MTVSQPPTIYVLMGVSGCGKSTVGAALAAKLGCPFYDGDDFHPPRNVAKMSRGVPLTDADREPWLDRLHNLIREQLARGETAVLACSALKKQYREHLRQGNDSVQFVYLRGDFDLIWQRLKTRRGHYMKADMLRSQFRALEEPDVDEAIIVDVEHDVSTIVEQLI